MSSPVETARFPRWADELLRFLPARSGFVLHGNIQDYHAYPILRESSSEPLWHFVDTEAFLHQLLLDQGYETVVFYDFVDGFRSRDGGRMLDKFRGLASSRPAPRAATGAGGRAAGGRTSISGGGGGPGGGGGAARGGDAPAGDGGAEEASAWAGDQAPAGPARWPVGPNQAMDHIRSALGNPKSVAVVINLASRLLGDPQTLSEDEREVFSRLWKAVREARPGGDGLLRNVLILLADKANDLPAWFYLENPFVKLVDIERPAVTVRRCYIDRYLDDFHEGRELEGEEREKVKRAFVDLTEGMKSADLEALRLVSRRAEAPVAEVRGLIDLYRFGVRKSPWDEVDSARLAGAEAQLRARVKGQDHAIRQALDILKRARVGLAGVQQSAKSTRPKGVLFFAGPTGVGKTELAKGLAELLFSDEHACIRFDMSEYQHGHTDQRLLGAPPGYIGYESGGQLTEAVRQRPFSVVLFDEIDKAHPSLFDKFLQIIDDGRITDGRGETVYFTESVLVFTSNLGEFAYEEEPPVYEVLEKKTRGYIQTFFTQELGRPELLNRFGENFVIFDYIRPSVADEIMGKMIGNVAKGLSAARGLRLDLSPEARDELLRRSCKKLEFGGRGIGNVLEKDLVNPLARYIFDHDLSGSGTLVVERLTEAEDGTVSLTCRFESGSTAAAEGAGER